MKRAAILLMILVTVLFAACGGDDDPTSGAGSDSQGTATDDSGAGSDSQGTATDDSGAGDTPANSSSSGKTDVGDFPFPVPDGGTVLVDLSNDDLGIEAGFSIDYPAADFDRIVAFYEDWVAEQPYPYVTFGGEDTRDFSTDVLSDAPRINTVTVLRVGDVTNLIVGSNPAGG